MPVSVSANAPQGISSDRFLCPKKYPAETVKQNQVLMITEAMKMETPVKAAQDGTVASINVAKGESVDTGKVLLTMN